MIRKSTEQFNRPEHLQGHEIIRLARPAVAVDILLFTVGREKPENYRKLPENDLQVLLIKRDEYPFAGQWTLPGGFVGMAENLDDAARRAMASEVQAHDVYLEQLYTWGDPLRDPRTRVISCSYMALVDRLALKIRDGAGSPQAHWFTVRRELLEQRKVMTEKGFNLQEKVALQLKGEGGSLCAMLDTVKSMEGKTSQKKRRDIIDPGGIGADHAKIIDCGIERLRSRLAYTDIVFSLMPACFTLTELQQVYEAILDKQLLKANFRRKIAVFLQETPRMTSDDGHRPAKLYRFNPQWNEVREGK